MRWLSVAAVIALFGVAAGSTAATSPRAVWPMASARVCAGYTVRANVAGKTLCLRDMQKCRARLARQYKRWLHVSLGHARGALEAPLPAFAHSVAACRCRGADQRGGFSHRLSGTQRRYRHRTRPRIPGSVLTGRARTAE